MNSSKLIEIATLTAKDLSPSEEPYPSYFDNYFNNEGIDAELLPYIAKASGVLNLAESQCETTSDAQTSLGVSLLVGILIGMRYERSKEAKEIE